MKITKNQILDVEISDLTYEGKGLAKVDNYPLIIDDALPGEKVKVKVLKANKNYGFAKVLEFYQKSPNRVEIDDSIYMKTGIAPLQHLKYDEQLKFKKQQVINVLHKFGLEENVAETVGMENHTHYRNKAQVPVRKVNDKLVTGFYKQKSHEFVPMTTFYLHEEKIDETLEKVCQILKKYKVSSYDEKTHQGVLRHIIIRKGHYSKKLMVTLVTRKNKLFKGENIANDIMSECPDVVSVMQNVNSEKTNVILGNVTKKLAGDECLTDYMLGQEFKIAANSFYQVNTTQAEKLYQKSLELAELNKDNIVIDAYCGIGTITLAIAPHVKHVYGVEVVDEAILNAKANAKLNNIDNTTFAANKAEDQIITWKENGIKPDVVFVDPPRKGLDSTFIETLKVLKPKKIIYISCNPATFARDIKELSDLYDLGEVYPYDLFPETTHVEVVTKLTLKEA